MGASSCPHHTNVFKISRLCGEISSFPLDVSPLNLVSFLILRRSFQRCRWIFIKTWKKKKWKGLLQSEGSILFLEFWPMHRSFWGQTWSMFWGTNFNPVFCTTLNRRSHSNPKKSHSAIRHNTHPVYAQPRISRVTMVTSYSLDQRSAKWAIKTRQCILNHASLFSLQASILNHLMAHARLVHHCARNVTLQIPVNAQVVLKASFFMHIDAYLLSNAQWARMQTAQLGSVKLAHWDVHRVVSLLTWSAWLVQKVLCCTSLSVWYDALRVPSASIPTG